MQTKTFLTGEVKALEDGDPNGSFEVILSAPTLDRDGEVIDAGAFEPLPKHITFDIDHGLSTATTVGSGEPRYEDGVLKVSGTFSSIPRAQEVRTLVAEGHIRTTSVAFMSAKWTKVDGVPHVTSAELLNGAFVPVASNREAVVLSAKSRRDHGVPGLKAVDGSYEQRRDMLAEAVRNNNPTAWWVYVVATFDDAVVYELEADGSTDRFRAPYTVDAAGTVTLGDPELVQILEVVEPVKGAVPEDVKSPDADPEEAAAARAAASPLAPSARVQAAALMAEAELLLA